MKSIKSNNSLGLLFEGFRQCKMIGILTLVITALGAALPPVGIAINADEYFVREAINAYEINPLMLLTLLAAPLMTLMLFHFLDSRPASDLYHALPHKRITLYASYAGAVLLWALLLIVVSTLLSVIFCAFTHDYIKLIMDSVVPYAVSAFLMCLLIVSGMLVAMGLSGTIFTNVILTGLILFLPRFCYSVLRSVTLSSMPFVGSTVSSGIFDNRNNLLVAAFFGAMDMDSSISVRDILSPKWQSIVYTLILSLIYLALGAWIFCRRRSEAAGQSAPSRMHQHVYRIVLTMAYCIFVTAFFVNEIFDYGIDASTLFGYGVLYLIGVLIYFIYELITTKKWRNLLTSLPGLAVVAVLNVGVAVGMHLVQNHIIDQRPAASEIESISIGTGRDNYYELNSSLIDYNAYVELASKDVKITDPTAISLVSYYLDENIKTWETGEDAYYNKYYNYSSGEHSYVSYSVIIRTKSAELSRVVMIPTSESDKIFAAMENNADYVAIWRNPPEPIRDTMYLSDNGNNGNGLTQEDIEELFEIYRQELKEASFEELYMKQSNYVSEVMDIYYSFNDFDYICDLYYPVYADLMPRTLETYYQMVYENQETSLDDLESAIRSGDYYEISIDAYNGNVNAYSYFESESMGEAYDHLKPYILDEPIQLGGAYTHIWLYPEDYNEDALYLMVALKPDFFEDEFVKENYDCYDME